MKITKTQLKEIVKEELLREAGIGHQSDSQKKLGNKIYDLFGDRMDGYHAHAVAGVLLEELPELVYKLLGDIIDYHESKYLAVMLLGVGDDNPA